MLVNKKIKKTELQSLLNESSGKGYTFIERIKKGIFGSQQSRAPLIRYVGQVSHLLPTGSAMGRTEKFGIEIKQSNTLKR